MVDAVPAAKDPSLRTAAHAQQQCCQQHQLLPAQDPTAAAAAPPPPPAATKKEALEASATSTVNLKKLQVLDLALVTPCWHAEAEGAHRWLGGCSHAEPSATHGTSSPRLSDGETCDAATSSQVVSGYYGQAGDGRGRLRGSFRADNLQVSDDDALVFTNIGYLDVLSVILALLATMIAEQEEMVSFIASPLSSEQSFVAAFTSPDQHLSLREMSKFFCGLLSHSQLTYAQRCFLASRLPLLLPPLCCINPFLAHSTN